MAITVVTGQETLERLREVTLRPGAGLHDSQAGRGVRSKHVDQAVALAFAEAGQFVGEVNGTGPRRVDLDLDCAQFLSPAPGEWSRPAAGELHSLGPLVPLSAARCVMHRDDRRGGRRRSTRR